MALLRTFAICLLFSTSLLLHVKAAHQFANAGIKVSAKHIKDSLFEITVVHYHMCGGANTFNDYNPITVHFKSSSGLTKSKSFSIKEGPLFVRSTASQQCVNGQYNNASCDGNGTYQYIYRDQIHLSPNETYWDIETKSPYSVYRGTYFENGTSFQQPDYHYGLLRLYKGAGYEGSTPNLRSYNFTTGHTRNGFDTISMIYPDPDLDSVVVRFDSLFSYTSGAQPIPVNHLFDTLYSVHSPLDSMVYDTITQQLVFQLTKSGVYVLPFKVYEYDRCSGQLKSVSSGFRNLVGLSTGSTPLPTVDTANISVIQGGYLNGYDIYFNPTDTLIEFEVPVKLSSTSTTLELETDVSEVFESSTYQVISTSKSQKKLRIRLVRPGLEGVGYFNVRAFNAVCFGRYMTEKTFRVHLNHHTRISVQSSEDLIRIKDTIFICSGDTAPLFSSLEATSSWRVLSGPTKQVGVNFGNDTLNRTWAAPSATTQYELSQIYSTCTGAVTVRDSIFVKVTPDYQLSISNMPLAICEGDMDTIQSIVSGGVNGSNLEYHWSGGFIQSADTLAYVVIEPSGPAFLHLHVKSPGHCVRRASRVVQYMKSTSPLQIAHDSTNYCTDDSVHLFLKPRQNASLNDLPFISCLLPTSQDTALASRGAQATKSAEETTTSALMWPNPFGAGGSSYSRQQMVYAASEFNFSDTITINELSFYVDSITKGDNLIEHMEIRLSTLSDSVISGWKPAPHVVFSDELVIQKGQVKIPLSSPFVLAKGQHLLVDICITDDKIPTSTKAKYVASSFNSCIAVFDNTTVQCSNRTGLGWASALNRPRLTIGYCDYVNMKPLHILWGNNVGLTDTTGMKTTVFQDVPRDVYVSFKDTFNACTYVDTLSVDTNTKFSVHQLNLDTLCTYDPVVFAQGTPSGGIYSGSHISPNGMVLPYQLPDGVSKFAYTVNPSDPCPGVDSFQVYLSPRIHVQHSDLGAVCETTQPFTINGGVPSGGVYTGNHISSQGYLNIPSMSTGMQWFYYEVNDTQCVYKDSFSLDVVEFIQHAATDQSLCESKSETIDAVRPLGGFYFGTNISQNGLFDVLSAGVGTHQVFYTTANNLNCADTASVSIRVFPEHQHSIVGDTLVTALDVNTYQAANTDTAHNYTWLIGWGQQMSANGNDRDVRWVVPGTDVLKLVGENPGCGSDTAIFYVTIEEKDDEGGSGGTGLFDTRSKDVTLSIYPIPAADKLTIQSSEALTSVKLYTMDMKLLLTKELPNEMHSSIDVSNLPAGVYFLRFSGEWGSVVKRIQVSSNF